MMLYNVFVHFVGLNNSTEEDPDPKPGTYCGLQASASRHHKGNKSLAGFFPMIDQPKWHAKQLWASRTTLRWREITLWRIATEETPAPNQPESCYRFPHKEVNRSQLKGILFSCGGNFGVEYWETGIYELYPLRGHTHSFHNSGHEGLRQKVPPSIKESHQGLEPLSGWPECWSVYHFSPQESCLQKS